MGPGASRLLWLGQLIQGQPWLLRPHGGGWHVSLRLAQAAGLWPLREGAEAPEARLAAPSARPRDIHWEDTCHVTWVKLPDKEVFLSVC